MLVDSCDDENLRVPFPIYGIFKGNYLWEMFEMILISYLIDLSQKIYMKMMNMQKMPSISEIGHMVTDTPNGPRYSVSRHPMLVCNVNCLKILHFLILSSCF